MQHSAAEELCQIQATFSITILPPLVDPEATRPTIVDAIRILREHFVLVSDARYALRCRVCSPSL